MEDYVDKLREFYKKEKIGRDNFNCRNSEKCFKDLNISEKYRGSEAYVGTNYGKPFKILFIPLDIGGECKNLKDRRRELEKEAEVDNLRRNRCWHILETLKALKILLEKEDKDEDSVLQEILKEGRYSMINSAKCCLGKNMNQAPWKFFNNCKEYIKAEVEILKPDIIITQGRRAADVFELLYPDELKDKGEWFEREGDITVNGNHKALVICAVHPSARGRWKKKWNSFVSDRLLKIIDKFKKNR